MENAVGDKKGCENIYGIMQMPQEHRNPENDRHGKEYGSQYFMIPKNESQEKWQPGVPREKKPMRPTTENLVQIKYHRLSLCIRRKYAQVGQDEKK